MPLMAASTWSHMSLAWATAAMAAVGSKAMELVVPWVLHTQKGRSPAARSAATSAASASTSIANDASWGTTRSRSVPMPAMRSPFSILECACAVA
jgi:hypothetical protein